MKHICLLCLGLAAAVPAAAPAAEDGKPMTTDFLEASGVRSMSEGEINRFIWKHRVVFTTINSGAREAVVYGDRRVNAKGRASDYEIGDAGIIEDLPDGPPRALMFYRYHRAVYACIDSGCPYLVTSAPLGEARRTARKRP